MRVTPHRAIAVVISDFIPAEDSSVAGAPLDRDSASMLRQANRRHDLVAVRISDRFEFELPALGHLVLSDAETGDIVEVNTGSAETRAKFAQDRTRCETELTRLFRTAGVDAIPLRTDEPYAVELAKFFETRERRRARG